VNATPRSADALRRDAIWTLSLCAALLLVLAMLTIAAPLGHVLLPGRGTVFFPSVRSYIYVKHAQVIRYVFAVAAAATVALGVAAWPRVPTIARERPYLLRITALLAKLCLVGVVVAAWVGQYQGLANHVYPLNHFSIAELGVAALIGAGVLAAAHRWPQPPTIARPSSPTLRRTLPIAAAIALTACWLAPNFYRAANIGNAFSAHDYLFTFNDDFLPLLNGRTPLVNYDPQYSALLGFIAEPVLTLFGPKIGIYTGLLCVLSLCAFLAVERTLALSARSELLGLVLFVPFLALSLQTLWLQGNDRFDYASYPAVFPMRYLGPYVLMYACVRHLNGGRARGRRALFVLGGLVALNNLEFGVPAFLGLAAALAATADTKRRRLTGLALDAAVGLVSAYAIVAVLTLIRAGALPSIGRLLFYARLYGVSGFNDLPTPILGLYLIVYVTFAATLVVAALRARRHADNRVLTGGLAFAGTFGLGAGSYYASRSHPNVLVALFSIWGLCVVLLTPLALRAAKRSRRRWLPATEAVGTLLLLGLMCTRITEFPAPWTQLNRIGSRAPTMPMNRGAAITFVRRTSKPGEHVVVLDGLGFLTARAGGVVDVTPYSEPAVVVTYSQVNDIVAALRSDGGSKLYLGPYTDEPVNYTRTYPEIAATLRHDGFVPVAYDSTSQLTEWMPRHLTGAHA
jgi:hypothetical protein